MPPKLGSAQIFTNWKIHQRKNQTLETGDRSIHDVSIAARLVRMRSITILARLIIGQHIIPAGLIGAKNIIGFITGTRFSYLQIDILWMFILVKRTPSILITDITFIPFVIIIRVLIIDILFFFLLIIIANWSKIKNNMRKIVLLANHINKLLRFRIESSLRILLDLGNWNVHIPFEVEIF